MAYYAVVINIIIWKYLIILGLHIKCEPREAPKTCESHMNTAASHAYFAETFLLDQIYLYEYVIYVYNFKAYMRCWKQCFLFNYKVRNKCWR
jgi:hypothetical protein